MLKTFLKLFLATGVPFGLCVVVVLALLEWAAGYRPKDFWSAPIGLGVWAGVLFGAGMALSLSAVQYWTTRKWLGGYTTKPAQKRILETSYSGDDLLEIAERALNSLGAKRLRIDRAAGSVSGETRPSAWSFGEIVEIDVAPLDGERPEKIRRLTFSSKPMVRTTMLDYGKGRENVEYLERFVSERVETRIDGDETDELA